MDWFAISNPDSIESPGLIVDANRVIRNIDRMLAIVGGKPERLRPHVKTHKMPDVIRLQLDASITAFKVATIAEAEMVAAAGAPDVLLAHQPVGPKIKRLANLIDQYPGTSFATIVDDCHAASNVAKPFCGTSEPLRLYIDIDCGMHRTGVPLGSKSDALLQHIERLDGVRFAGLHVYDGHLHQSSLDQRQSAAVAIIVAVRKYAQQYPDAQIIGGGSPTFGIWAGQTDWQCSPGTPVFWDVGYGEAYPDLDFEIAAALLTRVISKPSKDRICLDLGYKAISSEMPLQQRVVLPGIDDAQLVGHSEEHLVVKTSHAAEISVGDAFLAFPRHICPSVADYSYATVVRNGKATGETWPVAARR